MAESWADAIKVPAVADPCPHRVPTRGRCELAEGHHGPCTSGLAQATMVQDPECGGPGKCAECDRLDAAEVLRLLDGGELRPLQKAPKWLTKKDPSIPREHMRIWAERVLGGAR